MGWDVFDGWCASTGVNPMDLPLHRLLSLAEYAFAKDKPEKDRDEWERSIEDLARTMEAWLLDPYGTEEAAVGEAPPPSWWDEDKAAADAMALATRMSAGARR